MIFGGPWRRQTVLSRGMFAATCRAGVLLLAAQAGAASPPTPDQPWHAAHPVLSTPHAPERSMPPQCRHPVAEAYIAALQSGLATLETLPAGEGVDASRGMVTWAAGSTALVPCPEGGAAASASGMCWRELSDTPIVAGIVRLAPGAAEPHFHREMECYFGLSGSGYTWADGRMQAFGSGIYLQIDSKAIHFTPNTGTGDLVWFYWFPRDAHFASFHYQWRKDVPPGAQMLFDLVPSGSVHVRR